MAVRPLSTAPRPMGGLDNRVAWVGEHGPSPAAAALLAECGWDLTVLAADELASAIGFTVVVTAADVPTEESALALINERCSVHGAGTISPGSTRRTEPVPPITCFEGALVGVAVGDAPQAESVEVERA